MLLPWQTVGQAGRLDDVHCEVLPAVRVVLQVAWPLPFKA
jgi:hypothetical protein